MQLDGATIQEIGVILSTGVTAVGMLVSFLNRDVIRIFFMTRAQLIAGKALSDQTAAEYKHLAEYSTKLANETKLTNESMEKRIDNMAYEIERMKPLVERAELLNTKFIAMLVFSEKQGEYIVKVVQRARLKNVDLSDLVPPETPPILIDDLKAGGAT